MTTTTGSIARDVSQTYDAVLARLPGLLAHEGFGVLTDVDLHQVFAEKLGVAFRRYHLFGACNPQFAYREVADHPEVGIALPCNVAVYELEDGRTRVVAVDPMAEAALTEHDLQDVATEVRHRLEKVVAAV
jgi:uncharacterized protein (DUF302 family)